MRELNDYSKTLLTSWKTESPAMKLVYEQVCSYELARVACLRGWKDMRWDAECAICEAFNTLLLHLECAGPVQIPIGSMKCNSGAPGNETQGMDPKWAVLMDLGKVLLSVAGPGGYKVIKSERKPIHQAKAKSDKKQGASQLLGSERDKYLVKLENGKAYMHPFWDDKFPAKSWQPASTKGEYWASFGGGGNNTCTDALREELYTPLCSEEKKGDWVPKWKAKRMEIVKKKWYLAGFSLTENRRLYASRHTLGGNDRFASPVFHSAYTSGGDVLCTGSVAFEEGRPVVLTNQSGHYTPEPWRLKYVLNLFSMAGLNCDNCCILTVGKNQHGIYKGKREFEDAVPNRKEF